MENLRKFRVMTSKGEVFINARNMHDAISKARTEIGQLPNDINTKITKNVLDEINELQSLLDTFKSQIKDSARSLDWNDVYKNTKQASLRIHDCACKCKEQIGSMLKIIK